MVMTPQRRYDRVWLLTRHPPQCRRFRQALTDHLECGRRDGSLRRRVVYICVLGRGRP